MKTIKWLIVFFVFPGFFPGDAYARAVRVLDMKTLMKDSQLVFVGKVASVKPSGITTKLAYPTWKGVVFEWLQVEVQVVEPIKGTKKGEVIRTLMLSTRGPGPTFNAPGMVDPKIGQRHLLFLLPTEIKNVFASITAPFDDNQGIFLLDRKSWTDGATYYKDGKEVAFHEQNDKNNALWNLIDGAGVISADGVEAIRKKYKAQIAAPAPKDAEIHLRWRTETSKSGWQWNVPDRGDDNASRKNGTAPNGPITKP